MESKIESHREIKGIKFIEGNESWVMNAFPWFGHACRAIHSSNSTAPAGSKAAEWGGTRVGPFIRREIRFRRASVCWCREMVFYSRWMATTKRTGVDTSWFCGFYPLNHENDFCLEARHRTMQKIRDIDLDHEKK